MLYEKLGLQPSATDEEIKAAYKRLSMLYHPDKVGTQEFSSENEKKLAEKYSGELTSIKEILRHPYKKVVYDLYGMPGIEIFQKFQQEIESGIDITSDKETFISKIKEAMDELLLSLRSENQLEKHEMSTVKIGYSLLKHTMLHRNYVNPFSIPAYRINLTDFYTQVK